MRASILCGVLLVVAGCGSSTEPVSPTVEGTWDLVAVSNVKIVISGLPAQTLVIQGDGRYTMTTGTQVTTGKWSAAGSNLTITSSGAVPLKRHGSFTADKLSIEWDGQSVSAYSRE